MEDIIGGFLILFYILSNVVNLFIASRKYFEVRKSNRGQFIFFFGTGILQVAFTILNIFLMVVAGFSGSIILLTLFLICTACIYTLPWIFLRAIKSYGDRHSNPDHHS